MIKITFKNVGQGDSIILEWEKEGTKRIGIIDCKSYQNANPVLDHVLVERYQEIEFLILTHPHYDHFSGFLQLLHECNRNGIKVKYFLHTISQIPSFLESVYKSAKVEKELQDLLFYLNHEADNHNIKVAAIQANSLCDVIILSTQYELKLLSPSQAELNEYVRNSTYQLPNNSLKDNPKANLLSTVIKIKVNEGYLLLTSDCEKKSLIRIDKRETEHLEGNLLLGQSPHHGAFANHNNTFWRKRLCRQNVNIVFSVGTNVYGHPAKEVVDFFFKNNFNIYSTNQVGGLTSNKGIDLKRSHLDVFGERIVRTCSKYEGDQEFVYT